MNDTHYFLLFIIVFFGFNISAHAGEVSFNCDTKKLISDNNIKSAKLNHSTENETLYIYSDQSVALHLVCEHNFPKKIFIRRQNSVIMHDLVYTKLDSNLFQVDRYITSSGQRQLKYTSVFIRLQNRWALSKKTRFDKKNDKLVKVSDTFYDHNSKEIIAQNFYNYEEFNLLHIKYEWTDSIITGFEATDQNNRVVRKYRITDSLAPSSQGSTDDIKILVMDSGFDLKHEALAPYLKNSFAALNSIFPGKPPFEEILSIDDYYPPFSHGTMTSSVALSGLTHAQLIPLSGDPRFYNMEQIKMFLSENPIDFANMSFYLPADRSSGGPRRRSGNSPIVAKPSARALEIKNIIESNPETLWVAAAANGPMNMGISVNMDSPGSRMYPASLDSENLLVVGSVDTSEIIPENFINYQISSFSNYGKSTVDILAPGKSIKGAAFGGGYESWTGTSFSAPFALNICAKALEINPNLSPVQIKQLLLLSAYVDTSNPLPVKSGGIIYPERTLYLARLTKALNPEVINNASRFKMSLKRMAITAHQNIRPSNQPHSPNWRNELEQFWVEREL